MDRYKFRGKRLDNGEWVEGSLIKRPNTTTIGYLSPQYGVWSEVAVDPSTVGQYTGLKDKNGKEIYEGDIVAIDCDCDPGEYAVCNHEPVKAFVYWDKETCSFEFDSEGLESAWSEFEGSYEDSYTVIGNIHDNPELLKGE